MLFNTLSYAFILLEYPIPIPAALRCQLLFADTPSHPDLAS